MMEFAILLTAFAALLTSVITMLTVKEMKKQRISSHLPIIKILGRYSEVEIDKDKNWLWQRERLEISNFGKGVALDVKVDWDVNLDEIITMLKKYDPHNIKNFSLDGNFLSLGGSFHAIKIQSNEFFPAISEDGRKASEVVIPLYLTEAYGIYINEAVLKRPKESKPKPLDIEALRRFMWICLIAVAPLLDSQSGKSY